MVLAGRRYHFKEKTYRLKRKGINNISIKHYDNLLDGITKGLGDKLTKSLIFSKECYFDIKKYEFYFKDQVITLRKREKEFLTLLYENRNQVLTYDQIEEYIWKDKSMSMSALKTFIKELRQKLPIELIQNVPQIGYKLEKFNLK